MREPEQEAVRHGERKPRRECGKGARQQDRNHDGEHEEDDDGEDAGEGRDIARGEGPAALAGMVAVGLHVQKVVDDVGGRRGQAEAEEGEACRRERAGRPDVSKQQRHNDEDVLGPLVQPDSLEPRLDGVDGVAEGADGLNAGAAQPGEQAAMRVRDHRVNGGREQMDVGPRVADVGEAVGKTGLEGGQLIPAGEVGCAVRGEYAGEDAEVGGDALGQQGVRASGEVDLPAGGMLLPEVFEKLLIVGQMCNVKRGDLRDLALEGGLAGGDPAGEFEDGAGTLTGENDDGIDQRIGLDQGAVEVDAEGFRRRQDGGDVTG